MSHGDRAARRRPARRPLHRRQRDACRSPTSISPRSAPTAPLAEQLQGFSWLRDLAAAASREKGARLAEAVVGRWLLAHGTQRRRRLGAANCGASASSSGPPTRPTSCRARDSGYRSALLNTLARGARHLDANADKAPAGPRRGSPPGAAWSPPACSSRAACRASRAARPGLARALAAAQFDDGGLISRSPYRAGAAGRPPRPAARLLPRRQADHARRHRGRRRRRRSPRFMASPWATARCRAGRAAIPASRRG